MQESQQIFLSPITTKLWNKIRGHNSRHKRNRLREAIMAHLACSKEEYYEYMNGRKHLHQEDANYIQNLIVSYQCRP